MIPFRALTSAVALMIVFSSARASAQEASIIGSVSDETRAVLPGATITAINLETGVPAVAPLAAGTVNGPRKMSVPDALTGSAIGSPPNVAVPDFSDQPDVGDGVSCT